MIKYFMACYFIQSVKMMNRELLAFDKLPINMKKKVWTTNNLISILSVKSSFTHWR